MLASIRSHRTVRRAMMISAPILAAAFAVPAQAQIRETVTITNGFTTSFDPANLPSQKVGGEKESFYLGDYGSTESELGLNYTAYANNNGFFFLHDNYCVGVCATGSSTQIGFVVSNDGSEAANIRFDSQITPGHLARIYQGQGSAGFLFQVLRFNDGFQTLYQAAGSVSPEGITLDTGNLEFNGLRRQTGENFDLLDWETTNLSVNIGNLNAGSSTLVIYRVTYFSQTEAFCADVLQCAGAQVVFGDPRNNGGTNLQFDGDVDANATTGRAVIGADYGATFVPYRFVLSDAPPSFEQPGVPPQLVYDPLYRSRLQNNVPEPATWAMMIAGFGLAGSAVRRRRTSVRFA